MKECRQHSCFLLSMHILKLECSVNFKCSPLMENNFNNLRVLIKVSKEVCLKKKKKCGLAIRRFCCSHFCDTVAMSRFHMAINSLRPCRLRSLFLAGERCDVETLDWAKKSFGVPVLDHWWQTGMKTSCMNKNVKKHHKTVRPACSS